MSYVGWVLYWNNYYINGNATFCSYPLSQFFYCCHFAVSPPAIMFSSPHCFSFCLLSPSLFPFTVSFTSLLISFLFSLPLPRVQYLSSSHCHLQSVLHDPGLPLCHLFFREGAWLPAPACWDVLRLCRSDMVDNVKHRSGFVWFTRVDIALGWHFKILKSDKLTLMRVNSHLASHLLIQTQS